MWLLFVLPALIACVVADYEELECPREQEDIYPCTCSTRHLWGEDKGRELFCQNIRDVTVLDNVLRYTRGKKFTWIFMNVQFGDIPSNYFEGQLSEYLTFTDCEITSFGSRPFSGLEDTLVDLTINSRAEETKINMKAFPIGHLKKLEVFVVSINNIDVLEDDFFRDGPISLKRVVMNQNKMRRLGDKVFAPLVNLESVWFGYNKLVNVKRSMFPQPANKLKIIYFSKNNIASLPSDLFDDMPVLQEVDFPENELETISEEVWGRVWDQLTYVSFGYTVNGGIVCDERLKWIYQRNKGAEKLMGYCKGGKHNGKLLQHLTLQDFE